LSQKLSNNRRRINERKKYFHGQREDWYAVQATLRKIAYLSHQLLEVFLKLPLVQALISFPTLVKPAAELTTRQTGIDKIEDYIQRGRSQASKDSVSSPLHLGCHICITTAMPLTGYHWVCTDWPFTNRCTKSEKR
jgi:hypothetical protein